MKILDAGGVNIFDNLTQRLPLGFFEEFDNSVSNIPDLYDFFSNQNKTYDLSLGYYFERSGKKTISPFYEILITQKLSNNSINISKTICDYLISKFGDKWNRILKTYITLDYDPLKNKNISATKTANNTNTKTYDSSNSKNGTDTNTIEYNSDVEDNGDVGFKEVNTRGNTNTDLSYGYNSTIGAPLEENVLDETETIERDKDLNTTHNKTEKRGSDTHSFNINETDKHSGSDTEGIVIDETHTIEGYQGDPQDFISKELSLRDQQTFFDIIYRDIDSILTLQIYL